MSRLPLLTYRKLIRLLRTAGFVFDRQAKGSHEIWWNPQTRQRVTVPNHPGVLARGTLQAIIRQTGLTINEFVNLDKLDKS